MGYKWILPVINNCLNDILQTSYEVGFYFGRSNLHKLGDYVLYLMAIMVGGNGESLLMCFTKSSFKRWIFKCRKNKVSYY